MEKNRKHVTLNRIIFYYLEQMNEIVMRAWASYSS